MARRSTYLLIGLVAGILLTLFVFFVILAPSLSVGTPTELPKTEGSTSSSLEDPIVVTVKSDGLLLLQNDEVSLDSLSINLAAVANDNLERRIYLRSNNRADYSEVMKVMERLSSAGYSNIALITPPIEKK